MTFNDAVTIIRNDADYANSLALLIRLARQAGFGVSDQQVIYEMFESALAAAFLSGRKCGMVTAIQDYDLHDK